MTTLVVVETMLLVLVCVLVAGLLRSHAEILRRLNAVDQARDRHAGAAGPDGPDGRPEWLPEPRTTSTPAHDVVGTTLRGERVKIAVAPARTSTLIAFLSSGCLACRRFWDGLRAETRPVLPGEARVVVVTKDSSHESPSKLAVLAPREVPVVMSTATWEAYGVPQSPYFIYVDGTSGEVVGEGSAGTWDQVLSLLQDALLDAEAAADGDAGEAAPDRASGEGPAGPEPPAGGRASGVAAAGAGTTAARVSRADRELAEAGIVPGHPSLYAGNEEHEPRPEGAP